MKKILFYSPYTIYTYHFETELELAEKYLKEGHSVTFLTCNGNLSSCDPNPTHKYSICVRCISHRFSGIKWLGKERIRVENFYCLTKEQKKIVQAFNSIEISSPEDLKNICIEGSDIGMAAFGSVVCNSREPQLDIKTNLNLIRKNLVAAVTVHFSLKNILLRDRPDEVIVFNGRMAPLRPVLRLTQSLGIQTYIHERSGVLNQYCLTPNIYPHDLNFMKQEIELTYTNSSLSDNKKLETAKEWFEERSNNHPQAWISFTDKQNKDLLPQSFNNQNINIAIFNSSEDEMISIQGWENPFYQNQNDGILQIINEFKDISSLRFFLRMHPNLAIMNNSQTQFIQNNLSQLSNLEIIKPDSPVSTYNLVSNCDMVITFGSTVGIEAVYQGKPSILMGRALYEDLGGLILPKSHAELINILHNYILTRRLPEPSNSQLAFIKYGFFQKIYGYPFEYVKPYNAFEVSLQRHKEDEYFVHPSWLAKKLIKVLNKFNL